MMNRRRFLARGALAGAALLGTCRRARASANDRLAVGLVGMGAQGSFNLRGFLAQPDAQVVAVCDVHESHYRDGVWGKGLPLFGREPARQLVEKTYAQRTKSGQYSGCQVYQDYRELCAREDVDIIVVSTPDHWHAIVGLEAARKGKHLYGEKPVTRLFVEGQRLRDAVNRAEVVFQTGSQQRSMPVFHRAVEIVANGHLGKVTRVEVGLFEGYAEPQGDPTIKDPPAGLDYDMWCGPAAKLPYAAGRHHRWWRGNRAFGGGTLMDWIGHHNDIAHWALGLDQGGPETVEAIGWEMSACPLYDTPVHYEVVSTYAGGLVISISDRHEQGTKFIGEAGWLFVTRGRMTASNPAWLDKRFELGSVVRERSTDHYRNFLEAIRSKGRPIAPVDVAHRSITPGHLGYVSHALGRKIRWDADREEVVDDAEAQLLLTSHSYREPWRLDG